VELSVDNLDPCTLLTAVQRQQLGVRGGHLDNENFGGPLQGPSCYWSNTPASPDNTYTGGPVLNHGADFALGAEPLHSVDGFAATTTTSTGSDPNFYCGILVDVAPGKPSTRHTRTTPTTTRE